MKDIFQIADILVERVKRDFLDDIAIVAYYGSYATGTAHSKSDLDFFFIPCTEKGFEASLQFIIDGIGFDFWPISWDRAERIASFDEIVVPVIADAKILYARSSDERSRFEALQAKIRGMADLKYRKAMIDKAVDCFQASYTYLFNVEESAIRGNLEAVRMDAYKLITAVLHAMALLNQTYYTKGWGQNMAEVRALSQKPFGIEKLIDSIMGGQDPQRISASCRELVANSRELIASEMEGCPTTPGGPQALGGFYEEYKSILNKISAACERADYDTALFASYVLRKSLLDS